MNQTYKVSRRASMMVKTASWQTRWCCQIQILLLNKHFWRKVSINLIKYDSMGV